VLFGLAALALGVQAANALAQDAANGGAGQWLSAAAVSAVVALGFGWSLLRTLSVRAAVVSAASS